jgi:REP element-mobilizing transposase RayT
VHVTLKATRNVPNLRTRRRFAVIKRAFVRFCKVDGLGFRLVHFAVLSNHVHFVVEADSKRALSMGMQKLLHSISRRLNALNVWEHGAKVSTKTGRYRELAGWIGRVFSDRYHAHVLKTPTEMQHAVRYVLNNASHHHVATDSKQGGRDPFTSIGDSEPDLVAEARGFLLARACKRYLTTGS